MRTRIFAFVIFVLVGIATPVVAQTAAGRVKIVSGAAFIMRGGKTIAATPGQAVFASDTLRTGADGALGITLKDTTRLSLGPASEVRVERFVYAPESGGLSMVIKFLRGAATYVSGRIAKLAPDAVRLETPSAIVGVRGTTVVVLVEPR